MSIDLKGSRSRREERNVRKSIFLFFEGYKTEPFYFQKIKDLNVFDDTIISINIMRRKEIDAESNKPYLVYDYMAYNKQWIDSNGEKITVGLFVILYLNLIVERYSDFKIGKEIAYTNNKTHPYYEEEKERLINYFSECGYESSDTLIIGDALEHANKIMKNNYPEYDFNKDLDATSFEKPPVATDDDVYAMIVDRDQASFSSDCLKEILDKCESNDFKIIVTNPCFELWVEMHSPYHNKEAIVQFIKTNLQYHHKAFVKYGGNTHYVLTSGVMKDFVNHDLFFENNRNRYNFNKIDLECVNRALLNCKQYATDLTIVSKEINSTNVAKVIGTNMKALMALFK